MLGTLTVLFALAGLRADDSTHFRFALYGDCRDGHEVHRKLVARIVDQKPAFVIQTGDLVHRGTDDSLWAIYDEITAPLKKIAPIYPARGNHDVGGSGYETRFTAPISSGNKLYYSFDKANCHFVALAVDENFEYSPGSEQYKWLIADLQKPRKAQHVIVYFHVPPYSIGNHGSDLDVRKTLCPVFEKYGVDAVLNGHDHNYYRTLRNGILYVVSGGGGAPLYKTDPSEGAIEGDKWAKANHYIVFDVAGDTIHAKVLDTNDTTLDTFTIRSRALTVRR